MSRQLRRVSVARRVGADSDSDTGTLYVMSSLVRRVLFGTASTRAGSPGSVDSYGGDSMLPGVLPPARSGIGRGVTVSSALSLPAVYRSVQIISTTVAQLTLAVSRGGGEIPTPLVVQQPDPDRSLSAFLKRTAIGLATGGNAFWRRFTNDRGEITAVQVLDPNRVAWSYDTAGRRVWHYGTISGARATTLTLADSEISHLRLLEVPGIVLGLGPIQACRAGLAGALDVRDYAGEWFTGREIPTGILSTEQPLTKPEADAYRDRWREMLSEGETAILGKGLTYAPILLKPEDAQWIEAQKFSVTDVARMFGVPASYLLAEIAGSSMTYTNIEQVDTQFLRTTLLAYLVEIEEAMSYLLPRGQTVRFRTEQLLRSDNKTRADIQGLYIDKGVLSADEVRAAEGYGPRLSVVTGGGV